MRQRRGRVYFYYLNVTLRDRTPSVTSFVKYVHNITKKCCGDTPSSLTIIRVNCPRADYEFYQFIKGSIKSGSLTVHLRKNLLGVEGEGSFVMNLRDEVLSVDMKMTGSWYCVPYHHWKI